MRHDSPSMNLAHLLEQHWFRLLHTTAITESSFAVSVREAYEARVPAHARSIEWSTHTDPVARMRRDAEKINRWFREDIHARFPVEALEAFIAAFPPHPRLDLQIEIAARQGLLAMPMPVASPIGDSTNLGDIGRETGEAIVTISAMLDDGRIDRNDGKRGEDAIKQINEAMAVLAEMRERILRQAFDPPRDYAIVKLRSPSPR